MNVKRRRDRGDEAVGRLPYGKKYQRIEDDKGKTIKMKVIMDDEAIKLIKLVKNRYEAEPNLSMAELASRLNSENILKSGRKWTGPMARKILDYKLTADELAVNVD